MFIGNFLLTLQPFIVPLSGLAPGRTQFQWHAEGQFFSGFENSEILDADLVVCAEVEKSGHTVGLDLDIEGSVVVACDRCLADLSVPVSERRSFPLGRLSASCYYTTSCHKIPLFFHGPGGPPFSAARISGIRRRSRMR